MERKDGQHGSKNGAGVCGRGQMGHLQAQGKRPDLWRAGTLGWPRPRYGE